MPDFKPLPKPVSLKKPTSSYSERKPKAEAVQPKIARPKVIKRPYRAMPNQYQPRRAKPRNVTPFQRIAGKAYFFLRKRGKQILSLCAALLLAVSLISLLIWSVTGNNALAIYVGGELFTYIPLSQDIDAAFITEEARNRVQARENTHVLLNDQITIRPANATQRNIIPHHEAIELLASSLGFRINGVAIELNGNRIAVLRNESEANELVWRLQSSFLRGSPESYYSVEFTEDLQLVGVAVEEEALATIEYALNRLNRIDTIIMEYLVQSGDTLGGIALRHGTTLAQLYEDNPGISPTTVLRVGDPLRIQSTRPYLSVRTIEADIRTEPIPIVEQEIQNPMQPASFMEIIDEGAAGEQEVIVHIIRVNGIQTEPEQLVATNILREMQPRIVEVGTQ